MLAEAGQCLLAQQITNNYSLDRRTIMFAIRSGRGREEGQNNNHSSLLLLSAAEFQIPEKFPRFGILCMSIDFIDFIDFFCSANRAL